MNDDTGAIFFVLFFYIVIAELLRWKVTWCKTRPVLTYLLLFLFLGFLTSL